MINGRYIRADIQHKLNIYTQQKKVTHMLKSTISALITQFPKGLFLIFKIN